MAYALYQIIIILLDVLWWIIIIQAIMSWLIAFNVVNTTNRFVYMVGDFTHRATEPALGRIRRYIPNLGGMDISPIVLIILLMFLQRFILWGFAQGG